MRQRLMWIPAAVCAVALVGPAIPASAQGKGKGHAKHADQKKDKKEKHEQKQDDRRVGTSGDGMRFRGLDANGDGAITRREWRGNDQSFANHDWNRDGVLSGDEVRAGATPPAGWRAEPARPGSDPDEVLFARLDTNRNGVISRGEWKQSAEEFARLDADRNGVLSPYEFGVGR